MELDPAFTFGKGLVQTITIGDKKEEHSFKNTDHFGGELKYFSECILSDERPEPDGEEGFADVRVLEGIHTALQTGRSVELALFERSRRIDTERQIMSLRAVSTPELVHARNPGKAAEKKPKTRPNDVEVEQRKLHNDYRFHSSNASQSKPARPLPTKAAILAFTRPRASGTVAWHPRNRLDRCAMLSARYSTSGGVLARRIASC